MADLTPFARLDVAYTDQAFGLMQYCGYTCTWHLVDLINREDTYLSGLTVDPTGDYLIQQPVLIPVDAGTTSYTLSTPTTSWTSGTNSVTGKKFISQGLSTGTWSALHNLVRQDDTGFSLGLFRGGPTAPLAAGAAFAMYVEFSSARATGDYGLRLAIEIGKPLRLEGSYDNTSWTTLDIAADLGDSESYLNSVGRNITIDVVPLTDRSYYDGLPDTSYYSDPPPDIICVCINGNDAVLKVCSDGAYLASGQVKVTGTGGQWALSYSHRRYVTSAQFITNEIVSNRPFETNPICDFRGYAPSAEYGFVTPTLNDINRVYVSANISSPSSDIDATGYSVSTVILSAVEADFPRIYNGASSFVSTVSATPIEVSETHWFDQTTFLRRSSAMVTLEDNEGFFSPANLVPAVRAAQLTRGWITDNYQDIEVGITGLMALDGTQGIRWFKQGKQSYVQISISDLFRRGDADTNCVGFLLPFDGQCHYYSARQVLYRMGIGDDRMNFPYCQRDSPCPHYKLPRGTNAHPIIHFQPQTSPLSALLQIRSMSGEYSYDGSTILPMYLFCDTQGIVQYAPAPVGLVNQWLNPDFSVQQNSVDVYKTYSAVPSFSNGAPDLNEFVNSLGSTATLANIRTPIIFEGLSPKDGSIILGSSYNPALGKNGDPNRSGYIGIDSPIFNISRLFSSEEAVAQALAVATIQTSFPAIRTNFSAYLQPGLFPLMTIGVQDFGTQGNVNAVAYYVDRITNRMTLTETPSATTDVSARLLGQAG